MKIACLGGGPAGLYFAISMKLRDPAHDITVFERNRPDDTFGWGVVFSEETFDNITANDPVSAAIDPRPLRLLGRHRRPLSRQSGSSPAATASPASRASNCSSCCSSARANSGSICSSRPKSQTPRISPRPRSRGRGGWAEFEDARAIRRRISSPRSTSARTNSSGSARSRNSTTPSPSSSNKPSTAGSGRTPTSSTPTPRRSSSSARRRRGVISASAP